MYLYTVYIYKYIYMSIYISEWGCFGAALLPETQPVKQEA